VLLRRLNECNIPMFCASVLCMPYLAKMLVFFKYSILTFYVPGDYWHFSLLSQGNSSFISVLFLSCNAQLMCWLCDW